MARLRAYERAGVEEVIIQPIPPRLGMQAFAREIMPAFTGSADRLAQPTRR